MGWVLGGRARGHHGPPTVGLHEIADGSWALAAMQCDAAAIVFEKDGGMLSDSLRILSRQLVTQVTSQVVQLVNIRSSC